MTLSSAIARSAAAFDVAPASEYARAAVSGRLAEARSVIEDKFLELGKVLETSVEVVGDLVGALDELARVFNTGAVDDSTASLTEAAAQLNGLAAGRGEDRLRFQSLADAARSLGAHIADMQQALRYLRVFAVNIKVTAGGVPGAYAEFEDFAQEVLDAIGQGHTQLTEFGRDLEVLAQQVRAARSQEGELDRRCAEVLPAVPRQLATDSVTLADHHKRVAAVAGEVGAVARSLQGKVGAALGGLQIGDTTRQRVEHVETALALLDRSAGTGALAPDADAAVRLVLAAQLDDAAEGFNHDVDRMAESLAGVAADAHDVLRLRDAARGTAGRGDNAGVLARLEASLDQAMGLVRDLEAAETAAQVLGRSAEATAAGLARRIHSIGAIKASIRLMALNAHIKCCQLGDAGRPLSVIAVELRIYADALGDSAGKAEAILTQMAGASSAAGGDPGATSQRSATIGALLEAAAVPIRAAEGKAGADLASLAAQGESVAAALQLATGRLNFHGEVSAVLVREAEALRPATAEPHVPNAESPALVAVLGEIGKLYTMAREREIHRAFAPEAAG